MPISPGQGPVCASGHQARASAKKSGPPKLPDFSASNMSPLLRRPPQHRHAGGDFGPDQEAGMPRRSTTAPEVSPPATTSRRTPLQPAPRRSRPSPARWRGRRLRGRGGPAARRPDPASSCGRSAPAPRRVARRPRRARAAPPPRRPRLCSGSRRSTGMIASACAICSSVACEQLPARHAAGPPTGASARAVAGGFRPGPTRPARAPGRARCPRRRPRADDPARPRRWSRGRARTRRRRSPRRTPLPASAASRARTASAPAQRREIDQADLVLLCRASTRTRLASCIGLSGWSFSGLSFSGTAPTNRLP